MVIRPVGMNKTGSLFALLEASQPCQNFHGSRFSSICFEGLVFLPLWSTLWVSDPRGAHYFRCTNVLKSDLKSLKSGLKSLSLIFLKSLKSDITYSKSGVKSRKSLKYDEQSLGSGLKTLKSDPKSLKSGLISMWPYLKSLESMRPDLNAFKSGLKT